MKKSFILTLVALAALMAASCQKEETGRTLTATIEQYEHNSKAYINDEYYACWEDGDAVSINGTTYPIEIENTTATIAAPTSGNLMAFYPADGVTDLTSTGGTVTLQHTQTYSENSNGHQIIDNPMAAYCPEGSNELRFRNLCALLKVTIVGNISVKAIQVKGSDNQMLWGKAQLMLNNQGLPMLTDFTNGSNSVTLNFTTAVTINGSKSFYIVVPAASNFENLTIAVLTTDGTNYANKSKTSLIGQALLRNQIGAISYTLNGDEDATFTPDWMIRYTASAQVTPYNTSAFGDANYLSANSSFSNNSGHLLFDRPLTTIGNNAFKSCRALTTISLPATLTLIGNNAFQGCSALTGIDLSHTEVTSIGDNTFEGCSALTTISLPATLNSLGNNAFQDCSALTGIDLSHTEVTSIEDNAFESCWDLINISLPAILTSIGESAFGSCSSLKSISLPATLTRIGNNAFQDCRALTGIDLSHTRVTSIGDNAFDNCESLTTISLPANLQSIGLRAFMNCTSLSNISLPANLRSIGMSAFESCDHLTSIDLANTGVTSIGACTFKSCTSLTSIFLPANLTSIRVSAFEGCTSLGRVYCYATNPPELESNVFDRIPSDAFLFVPESSVSFYMGNQDWSTPFQNHIDSL